jgi:hypothetical protein
MRWPAKLLLDVVLLAWELPQNLVGSALLAIELVAGSVRQARWERRRLFVESTRTAVSLGLFVFWTRTENRWVAIDGNTKAHEYGHSIQSRLMGPLYLALVGLPSSLRAAYALAHREITGRRWDGYFDGYPESWADRLGGVDRGRPS